MRHTVIAALIAAGFAQDLPPDLKAKTDFDKEDASPRPTLQDALVCAQSQAAMAPIARSAQRYLIHYRKGYCTLFAAVASQDAARYQAAAKDFRAAATAAPKAGGAATGLRILELIARLEGGGAQPGDAAQEIEAAIISPNCAAGELMSPAFCQSLVETARLWQGWLA
ncbi:MAG: hypothetical protein ACRD96_05010, partial [Bryobacteraceae bacterium]